MSLHYGQLTKEDQEELENVIKEFLSRYRYLYEIRIQKLVYYGELYCIENYGMRLSNAQFKPYHYGSFSDTIRKVLKQSNIPTENVRRHGRSTHKYLGYRVKSGHVSNNKGKIIDRIHRKTRSQSTEELASESKESWLYTENRNGSEMSFDQYRDELKENFGISDAKSWRVDIRAADKKPPRFDSDAPSFDTQILESILVGFEQGTAD